MFRIVQPDVASLLSATPRAPCVGTTSGRYEYSSLVPDPAGWGKPHDLNGMPSENHRKMGIEKKQIKELTALNWISD